MSIINAGQSKQKGSFPCSMGNDGGAYFEMWSDISSIFWSLRNPRVKISQSFQFSKTNEIDEIQQKFYQVWTALTMLSW